MEVKNLFPALLLLQNRPAQLRKLERPNWST